RERETAPLLDAQTDLGDARAEHVLRLISGKRPFDSHPLTRIASLSDPADTMTLAEIRAAGDAAPASAMGDQAAAAQASSVQLQRDWHVIPYPPANLSIRDLEEMTGARKGVPIASTRRVVHLHGPSPDLTAAELETVAQLGFDNVDADRRGAVDVLSDVRSDLTIGELEALAATRPRIVVVIVIVLGPIIVVVVIDGGSGPSGGKSRNACKTMCV
ncbi:MAG TPA: hypothetical protein VK427_19905, partial [Kofleriaceae bacterium]|nr:hypothetical protein [Kofleriaceae bacterium]